MSTAILTLSENGELQKIHERWLSENACGFHNTENESEQLQLESFWGLFLICGIASFLALLVYFIFMVLRFSRDFPRNDGPSNGSRLHSARIQTFLNFVDEKEDVSQRKLKRKRYMSWNAYKNRTFTIICIMLLNLSFINLFFVVMSIVNSVESHSTRLLFLKWEELCLKIFFWRGDGCFLSATKVEDKSNHCMD